MFACIKILQIHTYLVQIGAFMVYKLHLKADLKKL